MHSAVNWLVFLFLVGFFSSPIAMADELAAAEKPADAAATAAFDATVKEYKAALRRLSSCGQTINRPRRMAKGNE